MKKVFVLLYLGASLVTSQEDDDIGRRRERPGGEKVKLEATLEEDTSEEGWRDEKTLHGGSFHAQFNAALNQINNYNNHANDNYIQDTVEPSSADHYNHYKFDAGDYYDHGYDIADAGNYGIDYAVAGPGSDTSVANGDKNDQGNSNQKKNGPESVGVEGDDVHDQGDGQDDDDGGHLQVDSDLQSSDVSVSLDDMQDDSSLSDLLNSDLSAFDGLSVDENSNDGIVRDHYVDAGAYPTSHGAGYPNGAGYSQGGYDSSGYQLPTGLTCWKCHAHSFEECERLGYVQQCLPNEQSCELEIRERSHYKYPVRQIIQINMGCKQKMACDNNHAQNFQNANPDYTQCRPEAHYTHSVCRQCCTENNCVKDPEWWYPTSREEWAYTEESAPHY